MIYLAVENEVNFRKFIESFLIRTRVISGVKEQLFKLFMYDKYYLAGLKN